MQDGRLEAEHEPSNKLTTLERQRIIAIANEPAYADLAPNKIVPNLADKGIYIASESSFYRVLKTENQLNYRQKSKPTRQVKKPRALTAGSVALSVFRPNCSLISLKINCQELLNATEPHHKPNSLCDPSRTSCNTSLLGLR